MTFFHDLSLVVPSLGVGAVLVAAFGMPRAYRKGRERTEEEVYVEEGLHLIREHTPKAIEPWPAPQTRRDFDDIDELPKQFGTLPEHERRVSPTPIGVEPVSGVSRDRSGLTSPAAVALPAARTSGNAAPPLDAQPPPRTGGLAGPQRQARLVTNLAYRRAQALIALDRVVAPLRTSTGRHRAEDMPRLYGTVAQRRHSAAEHQREVHLAWNTSTAEWPLLVLEQGWSVPEIPATVELGELVRS